MKSSNIGGQAVMEGIMMRHGDIYSVGVRKPDGEIEVKVADFAAHCARKLREEETAATQVTVFLMTNRFRTDLAQYNPSATVTLDVAASSSPEIISAALKAFRMIYRPGYQYKKAGVIVDGIVDKDAVQGVIFGFDNTARERQDVRCICLANAIKWNNPYFAKYKFKPMDNGYQKVNNNDVLLCVYQNELYDENNKKSWLANVSGESDYAESAFSNKFADVNDNFICRRSQDSFLMFNIKWKDGIYGVWASHDDTRYVVSYAYNPDIKTMCYTASDMSPNLLLLNKSEHPLNKLLKRAFSNGYLYYEDLYIRDVIYDIVTKMGVRR